MNEEMSRSLGRLEGKIDLIVGEVSAIKNDFKSLESGRLSRVEIQVANLTAKLTMIIAIATVATNGILFLIERFLLR